MNKEDRDSDVIDLEAPRLAWYKHKTWKKHRNTVYWVDIKLAQKKGFKFCQTRLDVIIFYDKLPSYCVPKSTKMETGEIMYEKVHVSPRPPPKIAFKENWMKKMDSEVAGGGEDSQQTQPKTKKSKCKNRETCCGRATIRFKYSGNRQTCLANVRTGRLVSSCVSVSVERVNKTKTHTKTWTPIK